MAKEALDAQGGDEELSLDGKELFLDHREGMAVVGVAIATAVLTYSINNEC